MYDIRHRLIWAISGFVSAVSLLVLVTLAGYGLLKALLLSLLILALVALILWILWVSEPESLVDILAQPPAELPPPAKSVGHDRKIDQGYGTTSDPVLRAQTFDVPRRAEMQDKGSAPQSQRKDIE